MSSNITAALAEPILSLPFHVTGVDTRPNPPDLVDTPPDCGDLLSPAWYRYTATSSDVAIGVIANPNYFPLVAIYSGAPGSLTKLDCTSGFQPSTLYVRATAGTTYYIVVCDEDGEGGGDLVLDVLGPPCQTVPAGSIAVAAHGLIWFLSSVDGTLLQMQQLNSVTSGFASEVLTSGPWLVQKTGAGFFYESHQAVGTLIAANLLALDDATYGPDTPFRRAGSTFYVPMPERDLAPTPDHYTSVIHAIGIDGTVVDGPWTLPDPSGSAGGIDVKCCGPSPDGTILYVVGLTTGGVTNPLATIQRYDLVNEVWLSDLATISPAPSGGDTFAYVIRDLAVLDNGNVVVSAAWTGVLATAQIAGIVNEYEPDGTLVGSYPVVNVVDDNVDPLINLALTPGVLVDGTIWVSFRPNADNDNTIRTFQQWVIAGAGTIAHTVEVSLANTDGPFLIPAFGSFFLTRVTIPACGGTTPIDGDFEDVPIRMERISPTMSESGKRIFYGRLQLDMQAGTGTNADPDPSVQLLTSNDAGQTWSTTRSAPVGRVGAYNTRVKWERNGMARNRVWRVWTDSRNVNAFTQAWLEAEEGES